MKKAMQNNGNWNVCYSNSSINYGGVWKNILPAFFLYIALGIILADVVIIIGPGKHNMQKVTNLNFYGGGSI